MISLKDLIGGSRLYYWRDVLYCPRWESFIFPSDAQIKNLEKVVEKLDQISMILGKPFRITSGLRPAKYNLLVNGAMNSAHIEGKAIDFVASNMQRGACNIIRGILRDKLEQLQIRMEQGDGDWVHIDIREPGNEGRYFKP